MNKEKPRKEPEPPAAPLSVSEAITVATILIKIADLVKYFHEKFISWKRSKGTKKEYDQIEKDVKEGNVDNINDRLR